MVQIIILEKLLSVLSNLTEFHLERIEQSTCDMIDIDIEQLHFNDDGELKYCAELLSPIRRFRTGNYSLRHRDGYRSLNTKILRYLAAVGKILDKFNRKESVFGSCLIPKIQHYIGLIKNKAVSDSNQD